MRKKRKSPTEIIESITSPKKEIAFIKFPGGNLIDVSLKRFVDSVETDNAKIKEEYAKHKKFYSGIHNHPRAMPLPSGDDIEDFLSNTIKNQWLLFNKIL